MKIETQLKVIKQIAFSFIILTALLFIGVIGMYFLFF